jgi:hypothetical protein
VYKQGREIVIDRYLYCFKSHFYTKIPQVLEPEGFLLVLI